jgi:hypothetical protein
VISDNHVKFQSSTLNSHLEKVNLNEKLNKMLMPRLPAKKNVPKENLVKNNCMYFNLSDFS